MYIQIRRNNHLSRRTSPDMRKATKRNCPRSVEYNYLVITIKEALPSEENYIALIPTLEYVGAGSVILSGYNIHSLEIVYPSDILESLTKIFGRNIWRPPWTEGKLSASAEVKPWRMHGFPQVQKLYILMFTFWFHIRSEIRTWLFRRIFQHNSVFSNDFSPC